LANYRIFATETFRQNVAGIRRSGFEKIEEKLRDHVYAQLQNEPHFGSNIKRLKNWRPPTWRYRVGSWRFFYEIAETEKIVLMIAAYHRGKAYR
jgi:mRNA interferase RelE/StbE